MPALHALPPHPTSSAPFRSPFSSSNSTTDKDTDLPSTPAPGRSRRKEFNLASDSGSSTLDDSPPLMIPPTPARRSPRASRPFTTGSAMNNPAPRRPLRHVSHQDSLSKPSRALAQAWVEIEEELENALNLYVSTYLDQEHDLPYHESTSCIEEAIATAQERPKNMTPDELWDEMAEAIHGFHEVGERRREHLEPMDLDETSGPADEEDEVEAPMHASTQQPANATFPFTSDWQLSAPSKKRPANPFEAPAPGTPTRHWTAHRPPLKTLTPPKLGAFT